MAIAKNFLKWPQAMALQFPLRFGRPVWNGSRPTTKLGREIRAYITREIKRLGFRREIVARPVPQWWKDAQARARTFAKFLKESQRGLEIAVTPIVSATEFERANPYRQTLLRGKAARGEIVIQ